MKNNLRSIYNICIFTAELKIETMKTHWKKAFNSTYLGSWDLDELKELTLTIKTVKCEETKGLKENTTKNIIYFEEKYKPMLCNVTNSRMLRKITGSKFIEDWAGFKITLYVREVKAFGDIHDALRIKEVKVLPELKPDSNQWKAAVKYLSNKGTINQIKSKYSISKTNEDKLLNEAI